LWKNCGKLFTSVESGAKKKARPLTGLRLHALPREQLVGIGEKGKKDGISEFYVLEHNLGNLVCASFCTSINGNYVGFLPELRRFLLGDLGTKVTGHQILDQLTKLVKACEIGLAVAAEGIGNSRPGFQNVDGAV
jgi:hypothetical protein